MLLLKFPWRGKPCLGRQKCLVVLGTLDFSGVASPTFSGHLQPGLLSGSEWAFRGVSRVEQRFLTVPQTIL